MHRRSTTRTVFALAVSVVTASLAGCNNSSDVIQPLTSNTQADVQAGAEAVAVAAPSIEVTARTVVSVLGQIQSAPASPSSGPSSPSLRTSPSCPPVFDLGNGISGTCAVAGTGEVTLTFSGTVDHNGENISVQGSLAANKAAQQPASGTAYEIDFAAGTSGPRGDVTWGSTAGVTVDGAGAVLDFALALTGTVAPASGQDVSVSVAIDLGRLELTVIGPRGGVLRVDLDRATLTGTVTLNGIQVAGVSIVNGCAAIDAIVPELEDRTICP